MMTSPHYITFSNIIIDDIVLWDGRTFMGTLGGAGTHALIGMRVWSERLGFVAVIGNDFETAYWDQLDQIGIDRQGIIVRDTSPTPRAWQLFEPDERRIEIFRTDLDTFINDVPYFPEMPPAYTQALGIHVQWGHTFAELIELLDQLRAANPNICLVWEPAMEFLEGGEGEFGPI
ncbi:MAG: hypothetical protein AAF485_06060, partial [Chloroflexota bacterium]